MRDLKELLLRTNTPLGIGLDGDCDRMVPMTHEGTLVPGDQLLALFADQILKNHPKSSIVFDIKSSAGLIELIEKWHGIPIMSPSGHSIIKNMMRTHNALLAGELSCHFFFKDRYFGYDDGIYALLRLWEIIETSQKSLAALLTSFPRKYSSPELRLAYPPEKKEEIITQLKHLFSTIPNTECITIDGIRITLPYGWGLVRSSNTQALLSMRFESDTQSGLKKIMHLFYDALVPYLAQKERILFTQQVESA